MKKAIINYINAKAEAIRAKTKRSAPCIHDWELIHKGEYPSKINLGYSWHEFVYRCKKCGETNKITSEL